MSDAPILSIEGLEAKVAEEDLPILKGLNLRIGKGEIHAIMGPNGSGKSTLAKVLAGHPGYEPHRGQSSFGERTFWTLRQMSALRLVFSWRFSTQSRSRVCRLRTS